MFSLKTSLLVCALVVCLLITETATQDLRADLASDLPLFENIYNGTYLKGTKVATLVMRRGMKYLPFCFHSMNENVTLELVNTERNHVIATTEGDVNKVYNLTWLEQPPILSANYTGMYHCRSPSSSRLSVLSYYLEVVVPLVMGKINRITVPKYRYAVHLCTTGYPKPRLTVNISNVANGTLYSSAFGSIPVNESFENFTSSYRDGIFEVCATVGTNLTRFPALGELNITFTAELGNYSCSPVPVTALNSCNKVPSTASEHVATRSVYVHGSGSVINLFSWPLLFLLFVLSDVC